MPGFFSGDNMTEFNGGNTRPLFRYYSLLGIGKWAFSLYLTCTYLSCCVSPRRLTQATSCTSPWPPQEGGRNPSLVKLPAELLRLWLFAQLLHPHLVLTELSAQPYLRCEVLLGFLLAFVFCLFLGRDRCVAPEKSNFLFLLVSFGCSHLFILYLYSLSFIYYVGIAFLGEKYSFISQE